MKKPVNGRREGDDLEIPQLGAEFFAKAEPGRYYVRVMAGANVVRIEPDLSEIFPNEAAVNQALRELVKFRETLTSITSGKGRRKKSA